MSTWAAILAGGAGTRFWPLSTPERPKQFLPLTGERPLLAQTVGVPPHRAILGCTHYPLVEHLFRRHLPPFTRLLTQPRVVADSLEDYLQRHPRYLDGGQHAVAESGVQRGLRGRGGLHHSRLGHYHRRGGNHDRCGIVTVVIGRIVITGKREADPDAEELGIIDIKRRNLFQERFDQAGEYQQQPGQRQ